MELRWALAVLAGLSAGAMLLVLAGPPSTERASPAPSPRSGGPAGPPVTLVAEPSAADARGDEDDEAPEPEAPPSARDPSREELERQLDEVIPARLYGLAAACTRGLDAPRDAKVKIAFRVSVRRGELEVLDASIAASTLDDPSAVECMRRAVLTARWPAPNLPDWEDEDELVVRVRGLKKHLAAAD